MHRRFVLRVIQLNSKEGSTSENHTLVIILCYDVINITRPNWHGIFVKDFVPQYTHCVRYEGHKCHHFNVTNIRSKQAMHCITSLHF